jgi:hypothetical protein
MIYLIRYRMLCVLIVECAGLLGEDSAFGENYSGNMDLGGGAGGNLLNESDDSL